MPSADQVRSESTAACRKHGAKVVSDAAYAAMSGRGVALTALGLGYCLGNLPALHLITLTCYELMSDEDKVADLTEAIIDAAKITAPPGAPKAPPDGQRE